MVSSSVYIIFSIRIIVFLTMAINKILLSMVMQVIGRPSIFLGEVIKRSSVVTLKFFKCSSGAFLESFMGTSAIFARPSECLQDSFRGPSGVNRRTSRVLRGSIGFLRGFFGGTLEVFVVLPCSSGVLP